MKCITDRVVINPVRMRLITVDAFLWVWKSGISIQVLCAIVFLSSFLPSFCLLPSPLPPGHAEHTGQLHTCSLFQLSRWATWRHVPWFYFNFFFFFFWCGISQKCYQYKPVFVNKQNLFPDKQVFCFVLYFFGSLSPSQHTHSLTLSVSVCLSVCVPLSPSVSLSHTHNFLSSYIHTTLRPTTKKVQRCLLAREKPVRATCANKSLRGVQKAQFKVQSSPTPQICENGLVQNGLVCMKNTKFMSREL